MTDTIRGRAIVVVEPTSNIVLAGLTSNAGGPLPPLGEIVPASFDIVFGPDAATVGESGAESEILLPDTASATRDPAPIVVPGMSSRGLEVREVRADEGDIRSCAGMTIGTDGTLTSRPQTSSFDAGKTSWDQGTLTVVLTALVTGNATAIFTGTDEKRSIDLSGIAVGEQAVFRQLPGADGPVILLAPRSRPHVVSPAGAE